MWGHLVAVKRREGAQWRADAEDSICCHAGAFLSRPSATTASPPLCLQALKEVETLRAGMASYEADKMALSQGKARLSHSHKQVKALEWENEVC